MVGGKGRERPPSAENRQFQGFVCVNVIIVFIEMMEENNETRVEWGEAQGGRREMVRVGSSRVKGLRDFLREKEEAERSRKQQSAALTLHHHYEQHELHFLLALNHYHLRHALRHIEAQIESPFTSQIQTHHHLISVLPTPQPRAYRVAVGGLNATEGGREAGVRLDFERSSIWVGDE